MRSRMFAGAALAAFALPLSALSAQEAGGEAMTPKESSGTDQIKAKVEADWPKYDAGKKGHLTREELGKWLGDLRTAAGQPAPDADWQKTAFAQTDTNGDAKVSVEELTAFLASGK